MSLSVKDALEKVLDDMNKLTPSELREELDKHSNGEFAVTMREMSAVAEDVLQNKSKEKGNATRN